MEIVYVYQGGRDRALEDEILAMFPGAQPIACTPGMQGLTEVTIRLPPETDMAAVHRLRDMPRILDAARASFGEGA